MGSWYIILRWCFSFKGTENSVMILEIMAKDNYIQILDENPKEPAEKL